MQVNKSKQKHQKYLFLLFGSICSCTSVYRLHFERKMFLVRIWEMCLHYWETIFITSMVLSRPRKKTYINNSIVNFRYLLKCPEVGKLLNLAKLLLYIPASEHRQSQSLYNIPYGFNTYLPTLLIYIPITVYCRTFHNVWRRAKCSTPLWIERNLFSQLSTHESKIASFRR